MIKFVKQTKSTDQATLDQMTIPLNKLPLSNHLDICIKELKGIKFNDFLNKTNFYFPFQVSTNFGPINFEIVYKYISRLSHKSYTVCTTYCQSGLSNLENRLPGKKL